MHRGWRRGDAANASFELTMLAEKLGIPVVFTWNGKGAIAKIIRCAPEPQDGQDLFREQYGGRCGCLAIAGLPFHRLVGVVLS
jgi:hypothetical protein